MISDTMEKQKRMSPLTILLVEDNPADARLIKELLNDIDNNNVLHVAQDGIEAMDFLHENCKNDKTKLCPQLIILDLNLPRMSGRDVLKAIKTDDDLKTIPVLILTTSTDEVEECYKSYANCYMIKPVDFNEFEKLMKSIKAFWLNDAYLPDPNSY